MDQNVTYRRPQNAAMPNEGRTNQQGDARSKDEQRAFSTDTSKAMSSSRRSPSPLSSFAPPRRPDSRPRPPREQQQPHPPFPRDNLGRGRSIERPLEPFESRSQRPEPSNSTAQGSAEGPRQGPRQNRRSRHRSRDRPRRPSRHRSPPRPPQEPRRGFAPDSIFDRPARSGHLDQPDTAKEKERDLPHRNTAAREPSRLASSPASTSKRQRSPGPPVADQDHSAKRPRRGPSPQADEPYHFDSRAAPDKTGPGREERPQRPFSPGRPRSRSPGYGRDFDRREKRKKKKKKNKNRRDRSRSPNRDRDEFGGPAPSGRKPLPQPGRESGGRRRSRSPLAPDRPRSFSRGGSPHSQPHGAEHPPFSPSQQVPPRGRGHNPSRDFDIPPERRHYDGRATPPPPEASRSRKKGRGREERHSRKSQAPRVSGANSVEVNMSARGSGYRGGYGPGGGYQMQAPYSQGPPTGPRRFSHSSGHATPNSFHGTPPPQSPYGGSQGWGGQQQYQSPSYAHQYPPNGGYTPNGPHNPGNFTPTGPHGQYHQSPSYAPPSGPNSQYSYPQGPARGGHRGGFRGGNAFNQVGRAGYRGNSFKSTSHNGSVHGGSVHGGSVHEGSVHGGSGHASPAATSNNGDSGIQQAPGHPNEQAKDDENPFRPSKDLQVEDNTQSGHGEDNSQPQQDQPQITVPQTERQPPSGPSNPKIKFQFKSSSKVPATIPKPEISSKFNALPPTQPKAQQQQQRQEAINKERNLPQDVPTGPASSRSRHDRGPRPPHDAPRQPSGQQPLPQPRFRMVKKTMRRPIRKEGLPTEMANSDSVYYRKPGNESVVGAGTYGKVFKAINVYTNNLVALKRIRMEGERDGFPVTAVREVKLLQSLRHINIVKLQEVMVEKNDCFMVFEYMSHDLTGLLNHPSFKLEAPQKKDLARQLFDSLDYLHRRGVLHRDIKAANILVSNDGILKLADFGLARFYAKHHQLDYTNRVITIWYRSPELLLGETRYGPAVDIWSAACVMVEILTQYAIFPGEGGEISQLDKIWAVLGTPSRSEWPGLLEMPWFELLRPAFKRPNNFAKLYQHRVTPAAFDLLEAMFRFDPAKRPSAAEILEHPYFTEEEPAPKQAVELATIEGDWHEFESKQLRRKNEAKEKEARRAARAEKEKEAAGAGGSDKKRSHDQTAVALEQSQPDAKRQNVDGRPPAQEKASDAG
ncbi:hypothetical protein MCOR27_003075 [Pyricularia oryzae]|uniref:cyclin-dependent kinase n=2 Tax=Pyricularia TaxID=48558 RepID=A0ABQ8NHU3_PYRGI|nr:hypothetical protein MCOR01_009069 [Pyricularia oryzae]KAI6297368.1 hypothetical protein MCOR33_006276 [Pyricularia grisea]KAI6259884.1 hypothetical protein MCOR19_003809 [Pyricularia oryzae]KAI6274150.1 hypothetical protein MCOR26_006614 [Pyricularia oryzae]KAI6283883.1 hypothetical protein MCOR27_003075 [Pyricularia oryzae]